MVEFLPNACSHQAAERVWFARVSREVERVPEREEHGIQARAFFLFFCFVLLLFPLGMLHGLCVTAEMVNLGLS